MTWMALWFCSTNLTCQENSHYFRLQEERQHCIQGSYRKIDRLWRGAKAGNINKIISLGLQSY